MRTSNRLVFTIGLLLPAVTSPAAKGAQRPRKKLIQAGWGQPTPAYLKEHWQQMEATTPFDGVVIGVNVRTSTGRRCNCMTVWQDWRWERAWFEESLRDLRSCRFQQFTDNFVRLCATPGTADWFSDQAWDAVAGNCRIMAWLAKEGGCKGICFDAEAYGAKPFRFDPGRGHSFEETCRMVRRRGAQFMEALAAEFPDVTVLTFFLNSYLIKAGHSDDPDGVLASHSYGLLPAFVNGMLDSLPEGATLVDAYEGAYYFDNKIEYFRHGNLMRNRQGPALRLVAPENRHRYLTQVLTGFGFFLDRYVNEKGAPYYIDGAGRPRLHRLIQNLRAAVEVTDEYVWLWEGGGQYPGGRPHRWWPDPGGRKLPLWEQGLPGITDGIRLARALDGSAEEAARIIARRRAAGTLKNLAANPSFEHDRIQGAMPEKFSDWATDGAPPGYYVWQDAGGPKGTYSWDRTVGCDSRSSVKVERVRYGSLIQKVAVRPGDWYGAEAQCLRNGPMVCRLLMRWQDKDGAWTARSSDRHFVFPREDGVWTRTTGVAQVPPEVGYLVVILQTRGAGNAGEVCWYDNVGIYRLLGGD